VALAWLLRIEEEARWRWLTQRTRLPWLLLLFFGVGPAYSALNEACASLARTQRLIPRHLRPLNAPRCLAWPLALLTSASGARLPGRPWAAARRWWRCS
jgi:hypothetical protein